MLRVVDVASHQAGIVTGALDCDAVICKATEGTGYVNPYCDEHYQSAKAGEKLLGVYHYASGGNPEAEAEFFINNVQGYLHEAILVLDWESGDNAAWGDSNWVARFCAHVVALTGINPMIYVQRSAANQCVGLGDYGIWLAEYPDYAARGWGDYVEPNYSGDYAMHQFTSSGAISGWAGPLDLSLFFGDATAWLAYAGANGETPVVSTQVQEAPVVSQNGSPEGSTLDLLYRTMNDEFGTGETRKANLGARYDEIQNIIEHIAEADAQTLANEVWTDAYGQDDVRRVILGSRYDEVQNLVEGSVAPNEVYHYTESGDTLSGIASQYGTTVEDILALNPWISNPNLIYTGQTIRVR